MSSVSIYLCLLSFRYAQAVVWYLAHVGSMNDGFIPQMVTSKQVSLNLFPMFIFSLTMGICVHFLREFSHPSHAAEAGHVFFFFVSSFVCSVVSLVFSPLSSYSPLSVSPFRFLHLFFSEWHRFVFISGASIM